MKATRSSLSRSSRSNKYKERTSSIKPKKVLKVISSSESEESSDESKIYIDELYILFYDLISKQLIRDQIKRIECQFQ